MPTIQRTAQAEEDLIDIWLYIAHDDVRAADRLLDEIEEKFLLLADQSFLGVFGPNRRKYAVGVGAKSTRFSGSQIRLRR